MFPIGVNPIMGKNSLDYEVLKCCMYPRVRNDIEGTPGSTPTKLRISLGDFINLDQDGPDKVNPFSDVPYSRAENLIQTLIGKPIFNTHDPKRGIIGMIGFAHLTDNPNHTLPESNDKNSVYRKKPIKYYSIMGDIVISKKYLKELHDEFHIMRASDIDCSIGYSYNALIDPRVTKKRKKEKIEKEGETKVKKRNTFCDNCDNDDEEIDMDNSMIYADDFCFQECSLCNHGNGACKGARVVNEFSKSNVRNFGMVMKLSNNAKSGFSEKSIIKCQILGSETDISKIQKKNFLKIIEKLEQLSSKKNIMATNNTVTPQVPVTQNKTEVKETTTQVVAPITQQNSTTPAVIPVVPQEVKPVQQTTTQVPVTQQNSTIVKSPVAEPPKEQVDTEFEKYLEKKGWNNKDLLIQYAMSDIKDAYIGEKKYVEDSLKNFPSYVNNFSEVYQTVDPNFKKLSGNDENILKEIATSPQYMGIQGMIVNIVDYLKKNKEKVLSKIQDVHVPIPQPPVQQTVTQSPPIQQTVTQPVQQQVKPMTQTTDTITTMIEFSKQTTTTPVSEKPKLTSEAEQLLRKALEARSKFGFNNKFAKFSSLAERFKKKEEKRI